MRERLYQHKRRISILLATLLLFLLLGTGVLEVGLRGGIDIRLNSHLLFSSLSSMFSEASSLHSQSLLLILTTGILLSLALPLLTPLYASALTVLSCIPQLYFYTYHITGNPLLPFEYNLLVILLLFTLNALAAYFVETHSRLEIVRLFGQYVPPQVVSELCRSPDSANMEGESRQMSVLFSDLQDFTTIAEQLEPGQVTMLLNEYFDSMTEILYRHGATIDKYIGDAIMAFWGAPLAEPEHARRAVLAAFEMQEKIQQLSKDFERRGLPGPRMGIGINTGMMYVGNMGSRYRIVYTVIGDAVNLASRIETLTRQYRVPVLVSESTMHECPDIEFREIDTVQVKGKQQYTRLYQPIGKTR